MSEQVTSSRSRYDDTEVSFIYITDINLRYVLKVFLKIKLLVKVL